VVNKVNMRWPIIASSIVYHIVYHHPDFSKSIEVIVTRVGKPPVTSSPTRGLDLSVPAARNQCHEWYDSLR
jgi:hypothetical protein